MEYVEAPRNWKRLPNQPALFLAGGITGCANWQQQLVTMLSMTNYVVLNPRRDKFTNSPKAAEVQIRWEFEHLRKADLISFWFCKESIQPITLFELGAWSKGKYPEVIVGVEAGYPRELDVRIQMGLLGRKIVTTLADLAHEIKVAEPAIRQRLQQRHPTQDSRTDV